MQQETKLTSLLTTDDIFWGIQQQKGECKIGMTQYRVFSSCLTSPGVFMVIKVRPGPASALSVKNLLVV